VEKFTQVNSILEEGLSLGGLYPLDECRALFVGHTDPSSGVLRAFPLLLPRCGDGVSHQLSSFGLSLGSEHLSSSEHFLDRSDTFVDGAEEFDGTLHLHVHELLNGVARFTLSDLDIGEGLVALVNVGPELADGVEGFSPLFLVKTDFRGADRGETLQLSDDLTRVEALDRSINVGGQAEDLGVVDLRKLRNVLDERTRVRTLSNLDHTGKSCLATHNAVSEDLLHVRA